LKKTSAIEEEEEDGGVYKTQKHKSQSVAEESACK